jgi:hypothetical protein
MLPTSTRTDQAKDAVAGGAVNATDGAQVPVDKAADFKLKAGVAAVATAATVALANKKAADLARETAEAVKAYAAGAPEAIAPHVEQVRETVVDDVVPKVASALAAIAARAAAAKESAVEAADRAPDAYAVLKGDAAAKKGGKEKWIVLLGALAAGAAVVAWRKGNHRPDPWATSGSYTQPKPGIENVGDLAAAAKTKVAEAKDATVETAGEPTGKATDATEHISKANGTDATATDTIGPGSSGPARDALAVPAPAILSDAEIDAGAFDDPAAAAEADDTLPSISEISEGADVSTPYLDSGSPSTRSSTDRS